MYNEKSPFGAGSQFVRIPSSGRGGLNVERERTVFVHRQPLVLGAERLPRRLRHFAAPFTECADGDLHDIPEGDEPTVCLWCGAGDLKLLSDRPTIIQAP